MEDVVDDPSSKNGERLLQSIVGARLSSVQFVLSYLILGFEEKGALTLLRGVEPAPAASRGAVG
jgi:hypothetical protein